MKIPPFVGTGHSCAAGHAVWRRALERRVAAAADRAGEHARLHAPPPWPPTAAIPRRPTPRRSSSSSTPCAAPCAGSTFTEPISGLAALEQSGLDITVADTSFGPAVCAIEGVGCPADNCFCDANRYWAYSYADGADWQSYPVGASQSVISTTGAIEGWFWGGARRPAGARCPGHRRGQCAGVAAQPAGPGCRRLWRKRRRGGRGDDGVGRQRRVHGELAAAGGQTDAGRLRARACNPVLAPGRGGGEQAGRRHCGRRRLPHPAQPPAQRLLQPHVGRLCQRQRLQRLGHPGRGGPGGRLFPPARRLSLPASSSRTAAGSGRRASALT